MIVLSLLTLFNGIILYMAYRDESILMFQWLKQIGIDNHIIKFRRYVPSEIPSWIYLSLPFALWNLSLGFSLLSIWYFKLHKEIKLFIIMVVIFSGLLIEVLQGLSIVRGTFDPLDLFLLLISSLTIIIITLTHKLKIT